MDPLLEDHVTKFRAQPDINIRPWTYSHGSICVKDQSLFLIGMKAYLEAVIIPVWPELYLIGNSIYKIWVQILANIKI